MPTVVAESHQDQHPLQIQMMERKRKGESRFSPELEPEEEKQQHNPQPPTTREDHRTDGMSQRPKQIRRRRHSYQGRPSRYERRERERERERRIRLIVDTERR
eukprot:CAMPEP_0116845666 /NCGR_PEP_ID=MMETSP0418-20121206/13399_1 /TAXON_ID=1158023 /ORGANISM="Astrosyne radiata, Strain 13vi08-1A" /LENGTH=102 /DNA_ID=CAMNT_0004476813 /DNA_START=63 /DNA_END=371 /DNA_ORIENTATION=+